MDGEDGKIIHLGERANSQERDWPEQATWVWATIEAFLQTFGITDIEFVPLQEIQVENPSNDYFKYELPTELLPYLERGMGQKLASPTKGNESYFYLDTTDESGQRTIIFANPNPDTTLSYIPSEDMGEEPSEDVPFNIVDLNGRRDPEPCVPGIELSITYGKNNEATGATLSFGSIPKSSLDTPRGTATIISFRK